MIDKIHPVKTNFEVGWLQVFPESNFPSYYKVFGKIHLGKLLGYVLLFLNSDDSNNGKQEDSSIFEKLLVIMKGLAQNILYRKHEWNNVQ